MHCTIFTKTQEKIEAAIENYQDLNDKLKDISKLSKSELDVMKKRIFTTAQNKFNLDNQMNDLIEKGVF